MIFINKIIMNKRILVSESEKNSILGMHESFKKNGFVMEQEEQKEMIAVQKFLNNRYKLNLATDGKTGPGSQTEKAIMRYQTDKKIYPSDGVAGHDTMGAMRKDGLDKFEDKFLGLF